MPDRPKDFTLTHRQHALKKGLVLGGFGRFPKSVHYRDSSLFRNNGTLTGMEPASDWLFSPELGRWALDFDGSNDYVDLGDKSLFSFNGTTDVPFSISAWVKTNGAYFPIVSKSNGISDAEYLLRVSVDEQIAFWCFDNDGSNYTGRTTGNGAILANAWQHVTATYNGSGSSSGIAIYVNGARADTTDSNAGSYSAMHNLTCPLMIGRWASSSSFYAGGQVSDFLVHSRALSPGEIGTLADPSDPTLDGLIVGVASRSRVYVPSGVPPSFAGRSQIIGGGVI